MLCWRSSYCFICDGDIIYVTDIGLPTASVVYRWSSPLARTSWKPILRQKAVIDDTFISNYKLLIVLTLIMNTVDSRPLAWAISLLNYNANGSLQLINIRLGLGRSKLINYFSAPHSQDNRTLHCDCICDNYLLLPPSKFVTATASMRCFSLKNETHRQQKYLRS